MPPDSRLAIVVNPELPAGLLANTVGAIGIGLGARLPWLGNRPLTDAERRLLPAMARAGALRFWISRLWDFYLPREASMLKPHDPTHFERVLRQRIAQPLQLH